MDSQIEQMREKIANMALLAFERRLTDTAGGNFSVRIGDLVCITSRLCGSKYQWKIRPSQVLVTDLEGNKLEGEGEISREAKAHYALYKAIPEGTALVHVHPQNVLVFAASGKNIPPVLESTLKFGEIGFCKYAPAHTADLAQFLLDVMQPQVERVKKQAAAAIAPWHGLFVFGKDFDAAFDAAERIELNARTLLMSKLLDDNALKEQRELLAKTVAGY